MMIRTENRLKEGYHFRNIAIFPESFRSHDSFPRHFPPLTIEGLSASMPKVIPAGPEFKETP
jgi:hypothetical protein